MTDTKLHWNADPNRQLLPTEHLSSDERAILRDLRRQNAQFGQVYRAARDAKPWPEDIPHTQMFEDCWLAGLDEREYLRRHAIERHQARQMIELRRQAAEILAEVRKADRARLKIERARRVRRQRYYYTTRRTLRWCGWMVAPKLVRRPRKHRRTRR